MPADPLPVVLNVDSSDAPEVLWVAVRYRGTAIAHWSMSQVTSAHGGSREVYRVDTDDGVIHEHHFHSTSRPEDHQGRRIEIESILTEQHGGYQQLAAAYGQHYDNCLRNWEGRLQRWLRRRP